MSFKVLLIILTILIIVCSLLLISAIVIKAVQAHDKRRDRKNVKKINPYLKKLLTAETVDFFKNHENMLSGLVEILKTKACFQTLENMLLDILEYGEGEAAVRASTIAYYFEYPEKCISMIRDRLAGNVAIGCRKAGLYHYADAIPDILKALDIVSSETQLQALMALARIGNITAMLEAFDKIYRLVLINERTVNEILNAFMGDRFELYKKMIHHKSEYLVYLFLKAIDQETAGRLIEDIIQLYKTGGKETRLACIIAIGKAGNSRKNYMLVHALGDKEWEIRAAAAKTLGVLTDPDAIGPLAKAARDREWWVRQNAVSSILVYPNCEEVLVSLAETGDKYAYDSIQYTLGRAKKRQLLVRLRNVWSGVARDSQIKVS